MRMPERGKGIEGIVSSKRIMQIMECKWERGEGRTEDEGKAVGSMVCRSW